METGSSTKIYSTLLEEINKIDRKAFRSCNISLAYLLRLMELSRPKSMKDIASHLNTLGMQVTGRCRCLDSSKSLDAVLFFSSIKFYFPQIKYKAFRINTFGMSLMWASSSEADIHF